MVRLFLAALVVLAAGPALAHHPMGGQVPETLMHGLLSGLGHPIIGLDHLVFIVAAGLLSAPRARGLILPLAFVGGSFAGSLLHLAGVGLPGGELLIAGSVILLGLLLVSARRIDDGLFAAILVLAGLFHGHAFAESIFGAEPTPLVAYLAGLAAVQYAIATGICLAWRRLALPVRADRFAGAGVAAAGALFLVLNIAG